MGALQHAQGLQIGDYEQNWSVPRTPRELVFQPGAHESPHGLDIVDDVGHGHRRGRCQAHFAADLVPCVTFADPGMPVPTWASPVLGTLLSV
jgi:hypothetical protein